MPRHRKSNARREVEGTAKKPAKAKPKAPSLPAIVTGDPEFDAPRHLGKIAKAEWRRLAPDLAAAGTLTVGDLALFEVYCTAFGEFRECAALVKKQGRTRVNSNKTFSLNPLIGVRDKAQKTMIECAIRLGLTPLDRGRVDLDDSRAARGARGPADHTDSSVAGMGPKPRAAMA